jgi:hypothetical protein
MGIELAIPKLLKENGLTAGIMLHFQQNDELLAEPRAESKRDQTRIAVKWGGRGVCALHEARRLAGASNT